VFHIIPQRLELNSGQTAEITLEGFSDTCVDFLLFTTFDFLT